LNLPSSREDAPPDALAKLPAKQRRSQITYDKLIESGFRLLEGREWDAIPVAEIAEQAGYSVGAFYARFKNKDEFQRALVRCFAAERLAAIDRLFAEASDEELLGAYFGDIVTRLWRNRFFWRACLFRSIQDPHFWEPMRQIAGRVRAEFAARAARRIGRPLTKAEALDLGFALQLTNGAINNMMINRPGPISLDDPDFVDRLEQAFRKVSGWDALR
jgi:AcrR family transcriptional regulator